MERFTVSTDSTCDLYADYMREHRIFCAPLTFTVEEKDGTMSDFKDDFQSEADYIAFYNRLRAGAFSHTSKLNYQAHYEHFLKLAQGGAKDVLHFTISSGLSSTKDIAAKAAADIRALYPDFNVMVVDPLTATVGQGALVKIAAQWRDEGKEMAETYNHVTALRPYIQHFIIADDLNYLYRGGRVSAPKAAIGGILGIKPMITFNTEGQVEVLEKNRGMKASLRACIAKFDKMPLDRRYDLVYIVHTDNYPAAEWLRQKVVERFGFEPNVSVMGPVIGSHLGPGGVGFGYFSENLRNKY
ncbi:MAG: DegV family protein [Clostridia bacterium]|nr:DegV family protein [Clostridia bacterium]